MQIASRALWQLAFALCLPSLLPGVQAPVCFRDPAFTVFDRRLISGLGGLVQTSNDGGWNPIEQPTFFYAPFCPVSAECTNHVGSGPEPLCCLQCQQEFTNHCALWSC